MSDNDRTLFLKLSTHHMYHQMFKEIVSILGMDYSLHADNVFN